MEPTALPTIERRTVSYRLTSSVDGTPIPDASVRVTTDVAGRQSAGSGMTDANGEVSFELAPGTYYVWRQKDQWNFINPDVEVVS